MTGMARVRIEPMTGGTACDQCMELATRRVLLDDFPLYYVCAAHEARVLGFIRAQLAGDGDADESAGARPEVEQ
ncbi:hypothetical protein ACQP2P_11260 [Dactylosporangium sp. CA-139114]|uniref:hypothetical protein n=1 Tax=Dactylosporangium sp. CA-139114 TaxID=3239931 RepID=UPI003D95E125